MRNSLSHSTDENQPALKPAGFVLRQIDRPAFAMPTALKRSAGRPLGISVDAASGSTRAILGRLLRAFTMDRLRSPRVQSRRHTEGWSSSGRRPRFCRQCSWLIRLSPPPRCFCSIFVRASSRWFPSFLGSFHNIRLIRNRLRCAHRLGFINDALNRIASRIRTTRRKFWPLRHLVGSASRSNNCPAEYEYDASDRETNNQRQNDFHQNGPPPKVPNNLKYRTSKKERPQEKPARPDRRAGRDTCGPRVLSA
jgi:hypothetical protein